MKSKFEEYDIEKLKKAKKILQEVLDYYYCYTPTRTYAKRLDTIVIKLNELIELNEEAGQN